MGKPSMVRAAPARYSVDSRPLVSVGLPTHNRRAAMSHAAASVLSQDWDELELVISDNASTDGTDEECVQLACSDSRVRWFRQERNVGPTENFRFVLREARGRYFMWLGDDDWLEEPSLVGTLAERLAASNQVATVAAAVRFYSGGAFLRDGQPINLLAERGLQRAREYFRSVADNSAFYGLMRRDDALACGLDRRIGNDWLVVASLALLGKVVTLETLHLARELTWGSDGFERIAAADGLSPHVGRWPHLSLCASIFSAIVWKWPVFRRLPLPARVWLAVTSQATVLRRFVVEPTARRARAVVRSPRRWLHRSGS
jgi:glycosyltransferase involved in cell wall biosynthesis